MNALKLKLEDLSVESFDTSAAEGERGTVVGQQCTCPGCPTCEGYDTCWESCGGTCGEWSCRDSCGGTCDQSRCVDSCFCRTTEDW